MGNRSDWTAKILQPFVMAVNRFEKPVILDLGRINSRHITYFGSLCWKIYVCDFLRECKDILNDGDQSETTGEPTSSPWERVLWEMDLAKNSLNGILLWDILDTFPNVWAEKLVRQLLIMLERGGLIFSFFGPQKPDTTPNKKRFKVASEEEKEELLSFELGKYNYFHQNSEIMDIFVDFNVRHFYTMRNGYRGILIQKT